MEVLPTYGLTALLTSLGLLAGFILARYVKEELKDGDKYFILLKDVLAVVILGILFVATWNVFIVVIGLILLFMLYFNRKNYLITIEYALLGILFFLAFNLQNKLVMALIFVYGLPAGTHYYAHQKKWLNIALSLLVFMVISVGLIFL